ncbi:UPF0477 protein BH1439, partial [Arthrobacter sp. Hiyo6]
DPMAGVIPAHITLVTTTPTKDWEATRTHVREVARKQQPFTVTIAGTGSFRPISPVVFLNVEEGFDACVNLHEQLQTGPLERDLPFAFHPHVTIAHDVAPESLDEAETVLKDYRATFQWLAWDFTSTTSTAYGSYGKSSILAPTLKTPEARPAQQNAAEAPLPTEQALLKLEVIRKRQEWGKVRRSAGTLPGLVAMFQWLLARLNAFRPMRAFQQYNLQHGPLMAAGIGFNMFFSITGLLATGFSVAGLLLSGQPALLDRMISSVAASAPGLLKVDGKEGLVDPQNLLNPNGLGWAAVIAAVVTVITSLAGSPESATVCVVCWGCHP